MQDTNQLTDLSNIKRFNFGHTQEVSDKCLDKVLNGKMTACCWNAVRGHQDSFPGTYFVIKDWNSKDRVVIRVTKLEEKHLNEVDSVYSNAEGYNDLNEWREMISKYFKSESSIDSKFFYTPNMKIFTMYFNIVSIL